MALMLTLTLLAVLSSASCYNFKWSTVFSHFSRGHTIQTLCCRKQSTTLWSMAQQISGNDGEEGSASKLIGGLMSQSSQNHVVDALKRGKDELSRDHRDNNITIVQALKVLRESMNSLVNQMRGEKETVRSKLLTRRIDIWQRQLATKFLEAEMLALNETFRAAMNETLQPAMYTHVLHEKAIIRLVRALRDARKG
jgi:hypothetical protein